MGKDDVEACTLTQLFEDHWRAVADNCVRLPSLESLPSITEKGEARRVLDNAIKYFRSHRDRMRYTEFIARGLPLGSGPVESAAKKHRRSSPEAQWNAVVSRWRAARARPPHLPQVRTRGAHVYPNLPPASLEALRTRTDFFEVGEPVCHLFGALRHPGVTRLSGGPESLLKVIARAGWREDADLTRVALIRPDAGAPVQTEVDVRHMIRTGPTEQNVSVQPGDIIFVPRLDEADRMPPARLEVGSRLQFVLYRPSPGERSGAEELRLLARPQTVAHDGTILVPYVGHVKGARQDAAGGGRAGAGTLPAGVLLRGPAARALPAAALTALTARGAVRPAVTAGRPPAPRGAAPRHCGRRRRRSRARRLPRALRTACP